MSSLEDLISRISEEEGMNPEFVRRMVKVESGGKPRAVSPKGAMGLMQLMPGTARGLGVKNPWNPEENLRGGIKYFKEQMQRFNDPVLALAAYNAGPGRAASGAWQRIPETVKYVNQFRQGQPQDFERRMQKVAASVKQFEEGQKRRNKRTGEVQVFQNGQWGPPPAEPQVQGRINEMTVPSPAPALSPQAQELSQDPQLLRTAKYLGAKGLQGAVPAWMLPEKVLQGREQYLQDIEAAQAETGSPYGLSGKVAKGVGTVLPWLTGGRAAMWGLSKLPGVGRVVKAAGELPGLIFKKGDKWWKPALERAPWGEKLKGAAARVGTGALVYPAAETASTGELPTATSPLSGAGQGLLLGPAGMHMLGASRPPLASPVTPVGGGGALSLEEIEAIARSGQEGVAAVAGEAAPAAATTAPKTMTTPWKEAGPERSIRMHAPQYGGGTVPYDPNAPLTWSPPRIRREPGYGPVTSSDPIHVWRLGPTPAVPPKPWEPPHVRYKEGFGPDVPEAEWREKMARGYGFAPPSKLQKEQPWEPPHVRYKEGFGPDVPEAEWREKMARGYGFAPPSKLQRETPWRITPQPPVSVEQAKRIVRTTGDKLGLGHPELNRTLRLIETMKEAGGEPVFREPTPWDALLDKMRQMGGG